MIRTDTCHLAHDILIRWNQGDKVRIDHRCEPMGKPQVEELEHDTPQTLWGEEEANELYFWENPDQVDRTMPDFRVVNPWMRMNE